jgi:hypothetical protein
MEWTQLTYSSTLTPPEAWHDRLRRRARQAAIQGVPTQRRLAGAVSIIHPKFLTVPTADSDRYGFLGAHLLALIHYANQLPDERNGRLLIDGAMWWQVSYADLAASVGGGVKRDSVWRKVAELESAGRLMSCMPGCEPGSSKADTTKAYRVPDTTSEPSDQSFRTGETPLPADETALASRFAPARQTHRTSATTPSHQRDDPIAPARNLLPIEELEEEEEGGRNARASGQANRQTCDPSPTPATPPHPQKIQEEKPTPTSLSEILGQLNNQPNTNPEPAAAGPDAGSDGDVAVTTPGRPHLTPRQARRIAAARQNLDRAEHQTREDDIGDDHE